MQQAERISARAGPSLTSAYTLGVEEEFFIVDPETRHATARAPEIIESFGPDQRRVKPELQNCMIEGNSNVCNSLDELRDDLVALRGSLVGAAENVGLAVMASGSAPLVDIPE